MKSLFKKPARITFLLVFFALGLMSFKSSNPDESMRKFWGSETNRTTSTSGCCSTTSCYTSYYVFWIETSTELTSSTIDCGGCQ
tara:strand:+ start:133 stop:384 length:252 start_codon:yes stop_codon:yes gene_type:complete